jgi:glutaminase
VSDRIVERMSDRGTDDRQADPRSIDLDALRARLLPERGGEVDDSVPELAEADPRQCGIALALPDGDVRTSEDGRTLATIQSAVKPFLYALALEDDGDAVLDAVGTEPTGEAFDAIKLERGTGRPPNPMVNAGALLTASLVHGADAAHRGERIARGLAGFAGRPLEIDRDVAGSERLLGDRNRALAHLMRSEGTLHVEVDDAVAVYADACSTRVTAADLAVMGATLAFRGRNPVTGERVVSAHVARIVMSVMATCGVYDGSGRWLRRVGVPAKSGVSGSIVMSSPDRLGAAVVSPPLDELGTSVRGALACEALSDELGLHLT